MVRPVDCGPRRAGFTLIELLVAISVLAVVAVLGWRGLDGIVRARTALNQQLAETRGMQLAFAQLQSDCAHLANATLMANRVPLAADDGRLLLVRTVYADDQPSRLQVVIYRLRNGNLSRQESLATRRLAELDTLWQAALDDKIVTPIVSLQPEVAAMTVRLWVADRPGWQATGNGAMGSSSAASTASVISTSTAAATSVLTGLEVALQLRGQQSSMVKAFLLGAV